LGSGLKEMQEVCVTEKTVSRPISWQPVLGLMVSGLVLFALADQLLGTSTVAGRIVWALMLAWIVLETVWAMLFQRANEQRLGRLGLFVGLNVALFALVATANPWNSLYPWGAEPYILALFLALVLCNWLVGRRLKPV